MEESKDAGRPVGKITAEQVEAALAGDVKVLAAKIAAAMNAAKAGSIINDSEEPVRDAHAEFREKSFQTAVDLLASEQPAEAFSPSASRGRQRRGRPVEEQGQTGRQPRDDQRRS